MFRPLVRRVLIACGLLAMLTHPADAARKKLTVADQYALGLRYMKRGYYVKALEQFNRIRNYHRDDPHAVKAELAIADVYYHKREWDQARLAYEDFGRMHPRHEDLDYVVYRIGMSIYQKAPVIAGRDQTWTRQALTAWSGYESRFAESDHRPEVSEHLDKCRERLARKELGIAEFYRRRKAPRAVAGRAEGLITRFPKSQHVPDALALLAWARTAQGDESGREAAMTRLRELDPALARRTGWKIARQKVIEEE